MKRNAGRNYSPLMLYTLTLYTLRLSMAWLVQEGRLTTINIRIRFYMHKEQTLCSPVQRLAWLN